MKKVLILSDSHGLTNQIDDIVNRHTVDLKIHCGDSELAKDSVHLKNFITVRGNCDWDQLFPKEEVVDFNGMRFFITHGHLYGVKTSLLQLQYRAEEVGANIILFGHSHIAYCEKHHQHLFLNPGSIRQPRKYNVPSYAILLWENKANIHVQYYDIEGNKMNKLPFEKTFTLK